MISKSEALLRLKPELITQLLHPTLDRSSLGSWPRLTKGLPASPGAAAGKVVFTAEEAEKRSRNGEKVGFGWDLFDFLKFSGDLDGFFWMSFFGEGFG